MHTVTLVNAAVAATVALSSYDLIGFASGMAYEKLYKQMNAFIEKKLPGVKRVFLLYTCGRNDKDFSVPHESCCGAEGLHCRGFLGCSSFDTFGPLKLIGGMNKGHPKASEINGAVDFFEGLQKA